MTIRRRSLLKQLSAGMSLPAFLRSSPALAAQSATSASAPGERKIAPGPFAPSWESLRQYKAPDWFRDAKFGIWAHWTAQCVPEQGDWYARRMYIQGDKDYDFHVSKYGHPSRFGFMEIDNLWKAENWRPEELMERYVKAGAKYFVALANHHDNFDCYDSRYHAWNSVRVGPKQDIVGRWAKLARERGLRFGVTNHSAHAWHWFQTAYAYDAEGPQAGVRYDAYQLKKEDGKGKWWEGLDPQELYTGRNMVMPDGLKTIAAVKEWHDQHDRIWTEAVPPNDPEFVRTWFLRCQELVDRYQPDLLYFDDTELPLEQAGLDIAAHFYNGNIARHGKLEAVINSKKLKPEHVGALVLDIERGRANDILPDAWQTDTCIGDWHYNRSVFERHQYKTAQTVIHSLMDIVSKNGNLLLNIPLRGDGTIDEDERRFLGEIATWIPAHGEAIFGTRPFAVSGEGAPATAKSTDFNERNARPYTSEDIRFTTKGETLYATALGWPENRNLLIKTLRENSTQYPRRVQRVELIGGGPVGFKQDGNGLALTLPERKPNPYAYVFKIN